MECNFSKSNQMRAIHRLRMIAGAAASSCWVDKEATFRGNENKKKGARKINSEKERENNGEKRILIKIKLSHGIHLGYIKYHSFS